ncbi:MAG: hypothetical protein J6Q07_01100 [Alistipes sp.]|nr:hypothetical protein [Alistipes sp.]
MKKLVYFTLGLVFLFIGYILGVRYPLFWSAVSINTSTELTLSEYYGLIVNIFIAAGTILAVIVALFIDEIKTLYRKVDIVFELDKNHITEETTTIKKSVKAVSYHNHIIIKNDGNINAQNCEIYIDEIEHRKQDVCRTIPSPNLPISWGYNGSGNYIPPQGKRIIELLNITPPQTMSTPDGLKDVVPAKIKFLGLDDAFDAQNSEWILTYSLYTTSSRPKRFQYKVKWDGIWEDRETEMVQRLTVELKAL